MDMTLDMHRKGRLAIHCVTNGPIQTNTYFAVSGDEGAIICTHGHADHIGGAAGLRRALGPDVPFMISEADAAIIERAIATNLFMRRGLRHYR